MMRNRFASTEVRRPGNSEDDDYEKVPDQIMASYFQSDSPSLDGLWTRVEDGAGR